MRKSQAINLNAKTASDLQLRAAIIELKREQAITSKAIAKRGKYSHLQDTFEQSLREHPKLYDKKIGQLTRSELQQVYGTYRGYFASPTYDDRGKFSGYSENKTSTLKGLMEFEKKVGTDVLGYEKGVYDKMTVSEQRELWSTISRVRELLPGYFNSKKLGASHLYGSGANIQRVVSIIDSGITDPVEIEEKLKELVNNSLTENVYDDIEDLPPGFR